MAADSTTIEKHQPTCELNPTTGQEDCRSRDIWLGLYRDFAERRKVGLLVYDTSIRANADSELGSLRPRGNAVTMGRKRRRDYKTKPAGKPWSVWQGGAATDQLMNSAEST
jgi:hypothetical protein